MSGHPHIAIRDLTLEYSLGRGAGSVFRPKFRSRARNHFRALDGLTLDFGVGDRVGLVGPNGSGKTTLLRVLAGVFSPTSGSVARQGSLAFILDSGFGLDANLSGRTNAYSSGIMRGLTRSESLDLASEVGEFAELGSFYDQPVKTYSLGMLARLVFATNTWSRPDILLMDEAIGAGDSSFQDRARDRVGEMMENSSILITASHSDEFLLETCNKGVFILDGAVAASGPIGEVIERYESWVSTGGRSRNQGGTPANE